VHCVQYSFLVQPMGELDQFVAQNLRKILPELRPKVVSQRLNLGGKREVDLYAKDENDHEYYIEIKSKSFSRIDIGKAVEYKALISKISPRADLILVCMSIAKEVREVLERAGIRIVSLSELGLSFPSHQTPQERRKSKALSPTEERAYFALVSEARGIVTTSMLSSLLSIPVSYAKNILDSLNKKQVIYRIGRGKYVLIAPEVLYGRKSYVADPITIVSELFSSDYYVAYRSAAYLQGLARQAPFVTTIAIPNRKRPVDIGSGKLQFVTVKRDRFVWGVEQMKYRNVSISISDLHRTILDCLERPDLCGGIVEVVQVISAAVDHPKFDQVMLAKQARMFGNKAVVQRLGFILERTRRRTIAKSLLLLEKIKSDFTYPLDPHLGKEGRLSEKWQILDNVGLRG